jgi:oxygen-dependent protoporphyrinogen oxidase
MARLAGAVTEHLRRRGVEVRTGVRVTGLDRAAGGWRLQTTSGPLEAAAVVLALPTTTTARLLARAVPDAAGPLAEVEVAGVAVVALAVPGVDPGTSGLLVPPVEAAAAGVDVKAVTFSGAKWGWVGDQAGGAGAGRAAGIARPCRRGRGAPARRRRPGRPGPARPRGPAREEHRAALAAAPAVVARWGGALPQYAPGHLERMVRVRSAVAAAGGLAGDGLVPRRGGRPGVRPFRPRRGGPAPRRLTPPEARCCPRGRMGA